MYEREHGGESNVEGGSPREVAKIRKRRPSFQRATKQDVLDATRAEESIRAFAPDFGIIDVQRADARCVELPPTPINT